jgi:hypothetical protein
VAFLSEAYDDLNWFQRRLNVAGYLRLSTHWTNQTGSTVTHAGRKRQLKWVATLPLGDINTEAWSTGMGVGCGANNSTL